MLVHKSVAVTRNEVISFGRAMFWLQPESGRAVRRQKFSSIAFPQQLRRQQISNPTKH